MIAFQLRRIFKENIEKFVDTCDKVLKQIPVVGKYSSRTYSYPGVIVP